MTTKSSKEEIISFVMDSSDSDNFIIAAFIAGMQAKENINTPKDEQSCNQP